MWYDQQFLDYINNILPIMYLDWEVRLEGYTFKTFLDITTTHQRKEAFVHLETAQCYIIVELQNCKLTLSPP